MDFEELCRTVVLCCTPDNIKAGLSKLKSILNPRVQTQFCSSMKQALSCWWEGRCIFRVIFRPTVTASKPCLLKSSHGPPAQRVIADAFFPKKMHLCPTGASCRKPGCSQGCGSLHFPTTFILLPVTHVPALCFLSLPGRY